MGPWPFIRVADSSMVHAASAVKSLPVLFMARLVWVGRFSVDRRKVGKLILLSWTPRAGKLINQWAFDHTMTIADGDALVALDMYEHAYHMDFGAKASP